jgi:hypothetical protein
LLAKVEAEEEEEYGKAKINFCFPPPTRSAPSFAQLALSSGYGPPPVVESKWKNGERRREEGGGEQERVL